MRGFGGAGRIGAALFALLFAHVASAAGDWYAVSSALGKSTAGVSTDFTPHGTQPGLQHVILSADGCGQCHGPSSSPPPNARAFMPYPTWLGSMMANAARDPLFWAALDVANHDVPGVGDYCLRCHTPRGWFDGSIVKGPNMPPNDPTEGAAGCLLNGRYDQTENFFNEFSGVNCHFCHRLMAQGPGGEPAYQENANSWIDDGDCNGFGEPCRRGPYDYSSADSNPPPHAAAYSAYHTQSDICGLCHNVSTPDLGSGPFKTLKLANGTDTGHPFPVERTFTEWQQSLFADAIFRDGLGEGAPSTPAVVGTEVCQSCHMPTSTDPNAVACAIGGYPNRSGDLLVHQFVGGNTWVPGIIKGEFGAGLGTSHQASLDQSASWARSMLQRSAAVASNVTSYVAPTAGSAGSLGLRVRVTNLSGHKLPTGYAEGRRMWLEVQVLDANEAVVLESGAYDASTGVLTADAQTRVYEVLQGIYNRNGTNACDVADNGGTPIFHFVLNDCIAKDNRIPPLGFRPATAGDPNGYDIGPVAATYPETTPGSGTLVNFDDVNYTFIVPAGTATPLHVKAKLYYQTSSKEYIEFLRDEAAANSFAGENTMCMNGPNRPFTVGPQSRTRGEYAYELWNNAPNDATQPGYGKSPPELIQSASAQTAN